MSAVPERPPSALSPNRRLIYFGCWSQVGHGFHDAQGRHLHPSRDDCGPWGNGIDSLHEHGGHIAEGTRYLAHKDGWTALDVTDRTIDARGGSHSAFLVPLTLTEPQMIALAWAVYPRIARRILPELTPQEAT